MKIDVKTCSICWCPFSCSNPKFLWQLNNMRLDLKGQSILLQITKAFSFSLLYKLRWLQVSSKCFALYFFKGTYLGICGNWFFCTWTRLFIFLASYLPTATLLIWPFKILPNVTSTFNGKKDNTNLLRHGMGIIFKHKMLLLS